MEVRPIMSALWRNKTGASLIALQIAVTLAVVVNALFIIDSRVDKISLPVGSDTANIFSLQTVALTEGANLEAFMREDLRRIRDIPGFTMPPPCCITCRACLPGPRVTALYRRPTTTWKCSSI